MKEFLKELSLDNFIPVVSFLYSYLDNARRNVYLDPSMLAYGDKNLEYLFKHVIEEYKLRKCDKYSPEIDDLIGIIESVEDERTVNLVNEQDLDFNKLRKIDTFFHDYLNLTSRSAATSHNQKNRNDKRGGKF
jgi:hypothetical protein